jgi:hypothetical protein
VTTTCPAMQLCEQTETVDVIIGGQWLVRLDWATVKVQGGEMSTVRLHTFICLVLSSLLLFPALPLRSRFWRGECGLMNQEKSNAGRGSTFRPSEVKKDPFKRRKMESNIVPID